MSDSNFVQDFNLDEDRQASPEEPSQQSLVYAFLHDYNDGLAKFTKACRQALLLNVRLSELEIRLLNSQKKCITCFSNSLKLQIRVIEGVRDQFLRYISFKASELDFLAALIAEERGEQLQEDDMQLWQEELEDIAQRVINNQ